MKKKDRFTLTLLGGLFAFYVWLQCMLRWGEAALIATVVIAIVIVAFVLYYKAKAKDAEARKEEAKATERILNTPLEKLVENDEFEGLDDLEEKYAEAAGVEPPKRAADAQGSSGASSKGAGRCSRCGTPLEFKGQAYCQKCGAKFVTTVHVPKMSETPVRPQQVCPAPQSPDASLNSQDINNVQYS